MSIIHNIQIEIYQKEAESIKEMCRLKYNKDLKDIIEVVKETVPKEKYISLEQKHDNLKEHKKIL